VKDECLAHEWGRVAVPMEEAVAALRGKCGRQTVDVHGALAFWSLLGFMLVHDDWLLPRPTDMIDLVRPLVHHDPLAELDKLARARPSAAAQDASADWVVPGFAKLGKDVQAGVRRMVERLVHDKVLWPSILNAEPYTMAPMNLEPCTTKTKS